MRTKTPSASSVEPLPSGTPPRCTGRVLPKRPKQGSQPTRLFSGCKSSPKNISGKLWPWANPGEENNLRGPIAPVQSPSPGAHPPKLIPQRP